MKPEVGIADRLLAEVRQSPVDLRSPIDLLGIENAQIESEDGLTRRHRAHGNGSIGLRGIDSNYSRTTLDVPNGRLFASWSLRWRRGLRCLAECLDRNQEH